jgi:Glycosyltransferase involved in LPS biosynthesis
MERWQDVFNQSFDKIFVITLERAKERQALVERELKGVNFEFVYGVDKQKFTYEDAINQGVYSPERAKKENRFYPSLEHGHIACSWSHRNVYELVVKNGYKKVAIFEDDVVVIKQTIDQMGAVLPELPSSWELLYFGYAKHHDINLKSKIKCAYYQLIGALGIIPWTRKMFQNYYAKPYSKHLLKAGFHDLAHAYAVSQEGAQKLLKYHTPIAFNADTMLAYAVMTGVVTEAYLSVPKLFDQEGISSYINSVNVED